MTKDEEEKAYWAAYHEYTNGAPSKLHPPQPDLAVDAIDETLDAPPFRPPTALEIQQELPIPDCSCLQSRFAVFVWYNPEAQSADWYTTMTTPMRPVPIVSHCPFCGDALSELVRKNLPEGFPPECYYQTLQK